MIKTWIGLRPSPVPSRSITRSLPALLEPYVLVGDAGTKLIERVADHIDCAKLTERIRRQGQCANMDLLCLHAADVDLRDVGNIVVAKRVHPAAANYGGAGRIAVTDGEEIVARAAGQSIDARAADLWSDNENYSIKHFPPPEQSLQTTKY